MKFRGLLFFICFVFCAVATPETPNVKRMSLADIQGELDARGIECDYCKSKGDWERLLQARWHTSRLDEEIVDVDTVADEDLRGPRGQSVEEMINELKSTAVYFFSSAPASGWSIKWLLSGCMWLTPQQR
jgi:hypothetical protein